MPYVINPDGSVTVLELEYDSNGASRPRRSYEEYRSQEIKSGSSASIGKSSSNPSQSKQKPRKRTVVPNAAKAPVAYSKPKAKAVKNTPPRKITSANIEPTVMGIDAFFTKLEETGQMVSGKILNDAKGQLPPILCRYLQRRYIRHLQILKERKKIGINNTNSKKAKKNKTKPKPTLQHTTPTKKGVTLADIATIKYETSESTNGNSASLRGGRKPKYGYARDFFGRVLERDILDEERGNEFRQAQKRQSNYDYSSFDENDDHDEAYSLWD